MPSLPHVRDHRAPGAGQRVCQNREGALGLHQPAADQHPPEARQGRFWPLHDALYRQQDRWAPLAQPRDTLLALAERAGVNRAKLLACLNAGDARNEVALDAQRAGRAGAHATPSFYIEGGLLEGAPYTPEPMRRLLDSIYAVRARPAK
ncbi:MAG: hypothetical protein DMD66_08685 [Gemmatimonadetes bacterium]|nr:MAG: hypothetical protein DMD66_08685 [Gemmatimonadota bacterium]